MFNPLVDDFSQLTDNEIEDKIVELGRKYWQARNPALQAQVATILEMYKQEAGLRRAKAYQKQSDQDDSGLDNLINVS
jgi:hypothetical protein